MILTKSQGERLAIIIKATRPEWSHASITTILQKANANEGLPAVNFDHAMRAAIHYATEKNHDGNYVKQTPGFIAEQSKFYEQTAPPTAPKQKAPPCEDHPDFDAHACTCCWADIKLGARPEIMLGKRMAPAMPSNPGGVQIVKKAIRNRTIEIKRSR